MDKPNASDQALRTKFDFAQTHQLCTDLVSNNEVFCILGLDWNRPIAGRFGSRWNTKI
jgi:hypothetical protein